ncbi:MAG: copper-containing nitrite reductase [Leptospiraceae bacterium]
MNPKKIKWFILPLFVAGLLACEKPTIEAELTFAPNVPAPIDRGPAYVIVKLETSEVEMRLADGVTYTFWTFGGKVPGPFIRVREDDEIEFQLSNHPDSKMPHNIDLHAVTGPGGGAVSSFTAPGHTSTFKFKALNPGLYIYHCATAPVGMHIANGMYGLILVEPAGGLPEVDREYYVLQSEFYTKQRFGKPGHQPFDMEKAVREDAEYVVFNGSVGALTDKNAITANKGETVRLFVGNGGPNLVSSFHVIGEIFDRVYTEGGTRANQENVQTTLIPAGGATIVEFRTDAPGTYILVDHSIFRAFNKGALGMLKVEGEDDPIVYSGKVSDEIYHPEGGAIQSVDDEVRAPSLATVAERIEAGKNVYEHNCAACHQMNGNGVKGSFPPLASSDYLKNKRASIRAVLHGLREPITVNGEQYNGVMPALGLSDSEIANVLTYINSKWNNPGYEVTPAEVKAQR